MAKYKVRYDDLPTQADSLQSIGRTLASFESRVNAAANAMDGRDSVMASLKAQIKDCGKALPAIAQRGTSAGMVLAAIGNEYAAAERKNRQAHGL